jgi:hypothetical protein
MQLAECVPSKGEAADPVSAPSETPTAFHCPTGCRRLSRDRGLPSLRVFVSQQSIRTFLCETLLPAPHHRATDIGLGRHLLHWPAVRAASTTSTRSMYLRGWLRSDAIASSRFLSDALNNTHIVCAMRIDSRVVNEQNMSVH